MFFLNDEKVKISWERKELLKWNKTYFGSFLKELRNYNCYIYLVFSSLEMQRRHMQTKACFQLFYSVWKKTSHKPWKVAVAKNSFPHGYNLLRWMLFIPCDNCKTLFFIQNYRYPEVWCNCHTAAFFETSILKEVRIFYFYLSITLECCWYHKGPT